MKTLVLFELLGSDGESFFFESEGDLREFNKLYINGDHWSKAQKLNDFVYDEDGNLKVEKLNEPTKDWDHFVKCGFIL